jgi:predicted aspartyl protease/tetratricopeptide (TPR) repeat protein
MPMMVRAMTSVLALACMGGAQPARAAGCHVVNYGTMPVEMVDGRATTMVKINGKDTRFIIDTGAFYNIMPRATADALGLHLEMAPQGMYISGVGGDAGIHVTHVQKFGILDATLANIEFIVGGTDIGMGLLGSAMLNMVDLDADLAAGKMSMMKPSGCGDVAMAYWAKDGNYNVAKLLPSEGVLDRSSKLTVMINGKPVKAELDTGAHTIITRKAAMRVGIDMTRATPGGEAGGIGSHHYNSWNARVDLYQIGSESIQNSRMKVIDGEIDGNADPVEMLLGLDFFLAHHIFVANSQRKIYFSYNGGRVSELDKQGAANASAPTAAAADEPKTAQDYGLRGQAHLERGEGPQGIADLDKAITMAPDAPASAPFYFARARGRMMAQSVPAATADAALADLDMALRLSPDMLDAVIMRARMRLQHHDKALALADIDTALRLIPAGAPQVGPLTSLLIAMEQPARTLPLLDDWIRLHPEDGNSGEMLNERCWARGLANTMLAGAQEDCRKAIRRNGENPGYLDSQALVELRLGHDQQALDLYTKVLAKSPDLAWSRYGAALARLRLGQAEGKAQLAALRVSNPGIVALAARYGLTPP